MTAAETEKISELIKSSDTVVIGAGAGLSYSAGFEYSGARFEDNFADFIAKYHFTDMYTAGFYSFPSQEELWAYWSRHIYLNRYVPAPKPVYDDLLKLVRDKDYFVLTTNVDHQFQKTGFDKKRLFYTQGDYGLWQCSVPCHQKTYDNEETVLRMLSEQKDMRVPSGLVPRCPVCRRPMTMNLRADDTFVEDEGWHEAAKRYGDFMARRDAGRALYLELGVGMNTPGIIKYNFWRRVNENPLAHYVCIDRQNAFAPREIADRSVCIEEDIGHVLGEMNI
jgi:NAD-dependent SIR2 family protein deacetylase